MSSNQLDVVESISSSPEPDEQAREAYHGPEKSTLSRTELDILSKDPKASSSRDADGAFYPSPYSTNFPSILDHDAAKPGGGPPRCPRSTVSRVDKYTSTLEYELASTKTKLAQANFRVLELERKEEELIGHLQALQSKLAYTQRVRPAHPPVQAPVLYDPQGHLARAWPAPANSPDWHHSPMSYRLDATGQMQALPEPAQDFAARSKPGGIAFTQAQ